MTALATGDPALARRTFLPGTVTGEPAPEAGSLALTVFPNPATTSATVRVTGQEGATPVVIVDALGRVVWTGTPAAGVLELSTASWAPGVYFARAGGQIALLSVTR